MKRAQRQGEPFARGAQLLPYWQLLERNEVRAMPNAATIAYRDDGHVDGAQTLALYQAQRWAAAEKPEALLAALAKSDALVTAWDGENLVGLGNAISDGHLVVYFPHLLVATEYQGRGIGREVMKRLMARYAGFHQQVVLADREAADFFRHVGFGTAGTTVPLWIYDGHDHG